MRTVFALTYIKNMQRVKINTKYSPQRKLLSHTDGVILRCLREDQVLSAKRAANNTARPPNGAKDRSWHPLTPQYTSSAIAAK